MHSHLNWPVVSASVRNISAIDVHHKNVINHACSYRQKGWQVWNLGESDSKYAFLSFNYKWNCKKYKSQVVERYLGIDGVPPDIPDNNYIVEGMSGSENDFSKKAKAWDTQIIITTNLRTRKSTSSSYVAEVK